LRFSRSILPPQQLRQLGDVVGDPAGFVFGQQLRTISFEEMI
jgi:hypothetical protein